MSVLLEFPVFDIDTVTAGEYLAQRVTQTHREQLTALFVSGRVSVSGRVVHSGTQVVRGQTLTLELVDHIEGVTDTGWRIIWENEELMAVFKPHGLPVSRTTRNLYHTLISLVRRDTPYLGAQLLHRLDTETAGLVLIAKDSASDKKWKPNLAHLIRRKLYQAWVSGVPDWEETRFECHLSEREDSIIRSQMYVIEEDGDSRYLKPKASSTHFRVLERERKRTLIECELFTGRKHQIRTSLAFLGHPVIGDKIYSLGGKYYLKRIEQGLSEDDYDTLGSEFHCLVATGLELLIDGRLVTVSLLKNRLPEDEPLASLKGG